MRLSAANPWVAMAILVAAIAVSYGNAVPNGFVFDDHILVGENAQIRSLERIPEILGLADAPRRYRPVRFVSYSLDHALFGLDARGFHLSNLFYHVACAFLFYLIAVRLTHAPRLALAAALLFALHPVNTDAVTYISGRRDLLSTLFYLLGFLAYVRYRDGGSIGWIAIVLTAFVLGLFSKEMVVTLPIMLLAYELYTGTLWESLQRHRVLFGVLLVLVALFVVEKVILNNPSTREDLYGATWGLHVLTMARVFAAYLGLLAFPLNLNADYSYSSFPVTQSYVDPWAWGAVVLLVGVLAVLLWAWREQKLIGFGGLWLFVALLPVAQIVPHHELMAEHYLYLPSVGFCLGVAVAFEAWLTSGWARPVAYAGLGVVLVLYGARTAVRNLDWRDDATLWAATVSTSPDNARAHQNLGTALAKQGAFAEAERQFLRSLEIVPESPDTLYQLGLAYQLGGKPDAALTQYNRAVTMRPEFGAAHSRIGQVHGQRGRYDRAAAAFAVAARLLPEDAYTQHELGTAYFKVGRLREAQLQYQRTLELDPDFAAGYRNLAIVESMLSNPAAADEAAGNAEEERSADGPR